MRKKVRDEENEGIGIFSIIILIFIAVMGIYYIFSHRHATTAGTSTTHVPMEAPAPVKGKS